MKQNIKFECDHCMSEHKTEKVFRKCGYCSKEGCYECFENLRSDDNNNDYIVAIHTTCLGKIISSKRVLNVELYLRQ